MNMPPSLITLRDGRRVLAKMYEGELTARTYANRTQAQRMAALVGGTVTGWHPFYVEVERAAKGESK